MYVINQSFLELCYERWGELEDHDIYIEKVTKLLIDKIASYEKFELAYSRSEILKEDFEKVIALHLLNIRWQEDIPDKLLFIVSEFHKKMFIAIFKTIKKFDISFKIVS